MSKYILLVEDTKALAAEIFDILTMEDYNVFVAGDGEQALSFLKDNVCDLIITDIVMPKIDGLKLVQEARRLEKLKTVPIIILSAKVTPETIAEGTLAGANLFIKKPCDTDYLVSSVHTLINQ